MMQLDAGDEDENGEPIARPLYYLNQIKYSASASVTAPSQDHPHFKSAGHSMSGGDQPPEANDQQILKNASFMVSSSCPSFLG